VSISKAGHQGYDVDVAQGGGCLRSFVGHLGELSIKKIYNGIPDYKTVVDCYLCEGFELSAFVSQQ
jgi:hypothetical protein